MKACFDPEGIVKLAENDGSIARKLPKIPIVQGGRSGERRSIGEPDLEKLAVGA